MNELNSKHPYPSDWGWLLIATGLCLSSCISLQLPLQSTTPSGQQKNSVTTHELVDIRINEASGAARSQRRDDLLWVHNDSGDLPVVYASNEQGEKLGRLRLKVEKAIDWEDMTSFQWQDESWLLLADIGDNRAVRDVVTLYILREPQTSNLQSPFDLTADVDWRIQFKYPDGPRDAEAVAVDVESERILILSKRNRIPRLYSLPLRPEFDVPVTATFLGPISDQFQGAEPLQVFGTRSLMPTAMDISPAGHQLVVSTYGPVYIYRRLGDESWLKTLRRRPRVIDNLPALRQQEAATFSRDGRRIILVSEQLPALLVSAPNPD